MTQALGSSRVQTEDFNQMLEGGLLPFCRRPQSISPAQAARWLA
jgi:hypothetical protein